MAYALAASPATGLFVAAFADATGTWSAEFDATGLVVGQATVSTIGIDPANLQDVALAFNDATQTFLLEINGSVRELDTHGAPISAPLALTIRNRPAVASRSLTPEWMVTTPTGFVRLGSTRPSATYVRGDMNGDGASDLILQRPDSGAVIAWVMNASAKVGSLTLNAGGTDWRLVAAADLTGDKRTDLLWQSTSSGEVLLWEMNGAAYARSTMLTAGGTNWRVAAAADFTGDGKTDILWQMPSTGAVLLWVMDGTNYVGSITLNAGGTYWQVVGAGDLNLDGQPDILWQHPATGALLLWEMTGSNYLRSTMMTTGGTYWRVVAVGDFALADGKPDIVWQLPSDGSVLLWTMNGTSYVASTMLSGPTAWQVKGPR